MSDHPNDQGFNRRTAGTYIPATNPFLKKLFNAIAETDQSSQINWAIDDLVQLLAQVDMSAILENFGRGSAREDPVVHFYETFLAAYDAALRKSRGVYYTPEPVVSFIVRSVDAILKDRFDLPMGLADNAKDPVTQQPRVQILDPATGTGTFLYMVVNQIYKNLEEMGLANTWNQYVQENLLSRLFGFELLMAPYAIAHLKLGLQLQSLGYQFKSKQRLGIYLTNTLDEALKKSEVLFGQFVAAEANEASSIKRDLPIMVILGNPPYSNFGMMNKGPWILNLLKDYKKNLQEKKLNLDEDSIKFIRFGQWRIEQTGAGILAFITSNTYIDGITHRRMRQSLMETFTDIYILDLHGSSKKKEVPDSSKDENVFDIQQGVAVGIFVKESGKKELAKVHYAELWGLQKEKNSKLHSFDIATIEWTDLEPKPDHFFFVPKDFDIEAEHSAGWKLNDIFPVQQNGVKTDRDELFFDFDRLALENRMQTFYSEAGMELVFREAYRVENSSSYDLLSRRLKTSFDPTNIRECLYRPFDSRWLYYAPGLTSRPAWEVMRHILAGHNLGLLISRQVVDRFRHVLVTSLIANINSIDTAGRFGSGPFFPLYTYPNTGNGQGSLLSEKAPNLSSDFLVTVRQKLGYTPTPEAIFYYIYAILHSPTYRQRYAEFLKIDFPRLPLTSDDALFKALGEKGQELVELHLMKSKKLNKIITKYQGSSDNAVTEVTYKPAAQQVWINKQQYFEGIAPEVWEFKIGGYQVLDKWLKDRKKAKRSLSFDEILHYQRVVVALKETMQIMIEIDQLIPGWPLV